jgi:hypothetical protein
MPVFRTLLALLACTALAYADTELRTLDGKTVKGRLVAITANEVTQQSEAGPVKTPMARVLAIDLRPAGRPPETSYTLVRLVDESMLCCSQVAFKGGQKEAQVELTLLSGQKLQVPLGGIVWLLREAQDQPVRAQWDKIVATRVKRDRIVMLNKGSLTKLEGTLGEVDAEGKKIVFGSVDTGKERPLLLSKLHGLIFYRSETPAQATVCTVLDTHGNAFAAAKVEVAGAGLSVTTPLGLKVAFEEKQLARLDYNRGKLTYLSDLEPVNVVERSGAGLITRYRKDANLDGEQPILLADKSTTVPFSKGLSMHAYTELEYDLDGKYKEFKAILGLDARTGSDSQALVTIECDGVKKFAETVKAGVLRNVAINVHDVKRLKIIVSSQNFLDLHDHATLAEARVNQ